MNICLRMSHVRKLIPLLFLLISLFIGCADDITQTGNTVTVHLTDINGFDYYRSNTYTPNVSIGDYPISLTDQTGSYRFSNITYPYDITAMYIGGYFTYKSIGIMNPQIVVPKNFGPSYEEYVYPRCRFIVRLPWLSYNQIAIIRFISKDRFFEAPHDFIKWEDGMPDSTVVRSVMIPQGVNSISGKLVLIYCNGYFEENYDDEFVTEISSFDSLAVKDVTLQPGMPDTISFIHSDMVSNLHESIISYSTSSNIYSQYTEAYLSFPGYSDNSDILFHRYGYAHASIPVISDLPFPFLVKMRSTMFSSARIVPQIIAKDNAGGDFELVHKHITINEPENGQQNVDDNTMFSFDDNAEQGIYVVELSGQYLYYTDKKNFSFKDFKSRGFSPYRGWQYSWRVYKISEFSSIDDFLSSPYIYRSQFSRISVSYLRYFRTAP